MHHNASLTIHQMLLAMDNGHAQESGFSILHGSRALRVLQEVY